MNGGREVSSILTMPLTLSSIITVIFMTRIYIESKPLTTQSTVKNNVTTNETITKDQAVVCLSFFITLPYFLTKRNYCFVYEYFKSVNECVLRNWCSRGVLTLGNRINVF